ncbi:GspH/FimT family pseudopilin [Microbaculum marinum]|uniref:GspH/FimT family pseudopilin n=1 Tax=Microbaculum marinum TaxID=1764581 RepID=A0AAW9RZZ2_9HYPH
MHRIYRASRPFRPDDGFALIEMVVALAIFGLVASLVLPRVDRDPGPAALEAKAYEIAAIFRDDRNAAMLGRREIVSQIDLDRRIAISGSRSHAVRVPDTVAIDLVQSEAEVVPGGGGIRFYPDGQASGGAVTLHRGTYGYRISVNWLTAAVDVSPVAAVAMQ